MSLLGYWSQRDVISPDLELKTEHADLGTSPHQQSSEYHRSYGLQRPASDFSGSYI